MFLGRLDSVPSGNGITSVPGGRWAAGRWGRSGLFLALAPRAPPLPRPAPSHLLGPPCLKLANTRLCSLEPEVTFLVIHLHWGSQLTASSRD